MGFIEKKGRQLLGILDSTSGRQLFRYLVTGVSAFAVEYLLYLLLYRVFSMDYAFSMLLVYSLLFVGTFVATRKWTFQSQGNLRRQLILYFLLFVFNAVVGNYFMMRTLVRIGIFPEFAPFIKTALITLWNFLIYKYIIYR